LLRLPARRARVWALAAVVVCLAGASPAPVPSINRAAAAEGGCGRDWDPPVEIGRLPDGLMEISGFVSSRRQPGVAWMIQDSGNPENLYSFQLDGNEPRWQQFPVEGVSNVDWEDIAYTVGADGAGRVWILENGVETGPKKLYEILEPDVRTDTGARLVDTYRWNTRNPREISTPRRCSRWAETNRSPAWSPSATAT